jgi:2-polyprenyl-6-methoxyphenol hydroxylase-like FAD-dependent oxidoreductase
MSDEPFDVVLIGYGPVGQSLALMLGRQGRKVAVCERWTERYSLPRAVCIDHELYRVLCANGMTEVLPEISHPGPLYRWFNAEWKELLCIDWSAESISGGAEVNFVHQPTLEEALDQAVARQFSVETLLGWEAVSIDQDEGLAHLRLRDVRTGKERRMSARFVVGCDGANSLVRETIGGGHEDRGFEADWLVIDVALKHGLGIEQLGIPAAAQYCNPTRPTTIVPAGVRGAILYRRWEFMRLPGETVEELEREERVWELLKPWAGPDQVELVRHKVYNFRSLLAERWRDRRLLIAGDAAHVMPPFMGQGMCSGLRDAWNLAWKLGLILDEKAGDRLLDSYQSERMPHVSQIIDMSIYLGKIICIPDPAQAAARDQRFFDGTAEPPAPFPQLVDGFLHRGADGAPSAGAGILTPPVDIPGPDFEWSFGEATSNGFVIVCADGDGGLIRPSAKNALAALGVRFVTPAPSTMESAGKLGRFLTGRNWAAMIVRPDYYVYGGVSAAESLPALIDDFLADLAEAGVHTALPEPELRGTA